ncbi:MAG: hypothetical protein ACI915_003461 [Gammaproteobacteria bacterium]|jgi:hypothetical protein
MFIGLIVGGLLLGVDDKSSVPCELGSAFRFEGANDVWLGRFVANVGWVERTAATWCVRSPTVLFEYWWHQRNLAPSGIHVQGLLSRYCGPLPVATATNSHPGVPCAVVARKHRFRACGTLILRILDGRFSSRYRTFRSVILMISRSSIRSGRIVSTKIKRPT